MLRLGSAQEGVGVVKPVAGKQAHTQTSCRRLSGGLMDMGRGLENMQPILLQLLHSYCTVQLQLQLIRMPCLT